MYKFNLRKDKKSKGNTIVHYLYVRYIAGWPVYDISFNFYWSYIFDIIISILEIDNKNQED